MNYYDRLVIGHSEVRQKLRGAIQMASDQAGQRHRFEVRIIEKSL
jgi:hypothetical protein